MKKSLGLAMIVIFGFILVGCGNRVPEGVSDDVFEIASQGLEIVDDYLDGDIDRIPAVRQLDSLIQELEYVIDDLSDYHYVDYYDEEIEYALLRVTDAVDDGLSYTNEREMQNRRDALADLLGKN